MSASGLKRKILNRAPSLSPPPKSRNRIRHTKPGRNPKNMLDNLEVTWLGTSAGAPSKTRNVSSTAIRLDGELWFVDIGEATQHQVQKSKLKMSTATKIFLTHMHGDHSFGLVPLLCALADGAGGVVEGADPRDKEAARLPPIDIYGLTGTRRLVRTVLDCTYTHLARRYRVHELLFKSDQPYGGRPNHKELDGRDIWINEQGCWPNFLEEGAKMQASAAPIRHTVPCVGFIFQEPPRPGNIDPKRYVPLLQKNKAALAESPWNLDNPMKLLARLKETSAPITLPDGSVLEPPPMNTKGRKMVILGDTYDAESEAMDNLAMDPDLLVHEATNAFLPGLDEAVTENDTYETIAQKCRSHGHSTPQVAGQFAKRVRAKNLFLNHFSARYIDAASTLSIQVKDTPVDISDEIAMSDLGVDRSREYLHNKDYLSQRLRTMQKIEEQASEAWGSDRSAVATRDFMSIVVKRRKG